MQLPDELNLMISSQGIVGNSYYFPFGFTIG